MRHFLFALGGLLLVSPQPGRAQAASEPVAPPRFYVGLGAYSSHYQKLGQFSPEFGTDRFRLPVQLTAGYQFTPRLAVQASAAYSSAARSLFVAYYNSPTSPTGYDEYSGNVVARSISASALARYTITNPAARLQVDALGGAGLEYSSSNSRGTVATGPNRAGTRDVESQSSQKILLATLGAGLRYRLTPHFDLTYDFTVNRALASDSRARLEPSPTTSHGLGLRYRFGQR